MARWLCVGRTQDRDFVVAVVDDPTNRKLPFGAQSFMDERMDARLDLVIEIGAVETPLVTDGERELLVDYIDLGEQP